MEATTQANAINYAREDENPVSTGDWFLTLLITAIPIVGLIMLFVWGFGGNASTSKANWAKATLLWMLVITTLYVMLFLIIGLPFIFGANGSTY